MTTREAQLRADLSAVLEFARDDGRVLIAPTKQSADEVREAMSRLSEDELAAALGSIIADVATQGILALGKRPADYWRDEAVAGAVMDRVAQTMQSRVDSIKTAVQTALRRSG